VKKLVTILSVITCICSSAVFSASNNSDLKDKKLQLDDLKQNLFSGLQQEIDRNDCTTHKEVESVSRAYYQSHYDDYILMVELDQEINDEKLANNVEGGVDPDMQEYNESLDDIISNTSNDEERRAAIAAFVVGNSINGVSINE
jgi:hypothetical protein